MYLLFGAIHLFPTRVTETNLEESLGRQEGSILDRESLFAIDINTGNQ